MERRKAIIENDFAKIPCGTNGYFIVDLEDLDITDHESYGWGHPTLSGGTACNGGGSSTALTASYGINLVSSSNISITDTDIHGVCSAGLYGGPINTITMSGVKLVGNTGAELFYFENNTTVFNTVADRGFICCKTNNKCDCYLTCKWGLANTISLSQTVTEINGKTYLVFVNEQNQQRVTSNKGCNCLKGYTKPVLITDPITGNLGYGCELTNLGLTELANNPLNVFTPIQRHYAYKYFRFIPCSDNTTIN
jgi:hypothetical protein